MWWRFLYSTQVFCGKLSGPPVGTRARPIERSGRLSGVLLRDALTVVSVSYPHFFSGTAERHNSLYQLVRSFSVLNIRTRKLIPPIIISNQEVYMRSSTISRAFVFAAVLGFVLAETLPAQDQSTMKNQVQRVAPVKDELREQYRPGDHMKNVEHSPGVVRSSGTSDVLVNNNNGATPTGNFTQSETDILAFGNNVVIVFNDAGSYNGANNQFTGYSYSTDGGATFTDGGTLPVSAVGDAGDPVLARNETTGRIYFSTLGFSGAGTIQMWRSSDNGVTWMAPVNATPGGGSEDKQWHTVDNFAGTGNGNVYLLTRNFGAGAGIFFYRSTDHGDTFGPSGGTLIVSGQQGAFVAVGPDHSVYAFWYNGTTLQMRKSIDLGLTFAPAVIVASGLVGGVNGDLGLVGARQGLPTPSAFRSSEFPHVAINPISGNIYVTYANDGVGVDKADVFLVQSTNGGASWSAGVKINDDVTTTDQWMPTIAVTPSGSQLGIFYYSRQEDPTSNNLFRYYGRIGNISGSTVTFNPSFAISDVASLPEFGRDAPIVTTYMGDYNHAVTTPAAFHVVWSDNRDDFALGPPRKDPNVYYKSIPTTQNFGWAQGFVTTPTAGSIPVQGVLVEFVEPLIQVPGTSAGDGSYFAGAKVDTPALTANYTIRATKFGYVDFTDTITIVRDDTVARNISMTPAPGGTLTVHAFRSDTSGIGADVHVFLGATEVVTGATDTSTGLFSTPLPVGTYDVVVDPPSPYGTRSFSGVVILVSQTTTVDALVRFVVEASPTAMRDTLVVEQVHAKTLTLTNTTSDTVPYRISDDNALARFRISKPAVQPPAHPIPAIERPKGVPQPAGPAQINGRGGPDGFGYSWIDSDEPGGPTFNWVNIRGVGTQIIGLLDDNNLGPFPMGFSFPFYGNNFNQIRVASNGFVSFTSTVSPFTNGSIPSAAEPNNAIYPFWDDLLFSATNGSTAWYYYDAANSRFIVQYDSVPFFGATPGRNTFQVILKPNGEVLVQYLAMTGTVSSATVGIENANGTVALQVVFNAAYIHDNLATRYYLPDAPWLSENPGSGTLSANSSQDITVTFDATGLLVGTTYNANIFVDATHPDVSGRLTVPASLKVNPADSAVLILSRATMTFPTTPVNVTRRDSLAARNGGLLPLDISSLSTTNSDFVVTPTSALLAPGDSVHVYVDYTPSAAESDTGRIIILSNSQGTPRSDVILNGTGIGVPDFAARIDSLVKTIEGGVRDSILFYVRNDGTGSGDFAARAVMYPRTVAPGQSSKPLVIPVTIRPAQETASDRGLSPWEANGISEAEYRALPNEKPLFGIPNVAAKRADALSTLTVFENFDRPDPWPWSPWVVVAAAGGTTAGACAHDGPQGITDGTGTLNWHYRTDVTLGAPDERVSIWAKPAAATVGRLYMGFGATAAGCWSLVAAPNTSQLQIQQNSAYGFLTLVAVSQIWTAGSWYKLEMVFGSGGLVTGNLYASDGTTLLNTVSTTLSGFAPAGVAIRAFSSATTDFCGDTFEGGLPGVPWFSVSPTSGTIAIGDSTLMVARFDATDSTIYNNPGNYYGRFEMNATNSTLADSLNLPVRMFVQPPAGPRLAVNPDTLGFGNVEIDSSRTLSTLVRNIGAATLNVTGIVMSDPNYSANPTSFSLASLDTQRVNVTFTAPSPGAVHDGTMSFTSNDPSAPQVRLGARSLGVAHIALSPDAFQFDVAATNDTTTQNMMVANTGTDTLQYVITEASVAFATSSPTMERSRQQQQSYDLPKGGMDSRSGPAQVNGRGGPDAFGYIWIDSDEPGGPTFNWVDISSVGTPIVGLDDDNFAGPFAIGFAFPFYGNNFTNVNVMSNGFFSFTSTVSPFTNTAIPATAEPNNALYEFWDDLNFALGGTAHFYYDAGNNRFIIQFTDVPYFSGAGTCTFEVILKPSGDIIYQYLSMSGLLTSATIGIENATGTIGLQVVFNNTYIHNNLAVLFTTDLFPWLSTSRTSGTVAPGDSQEVQVRVHPGLGFLPGSYPARLVATGNTPDTRFASVNMDVTIPDTTFVNVTDPNGGEQWAVGLDYAITWIANRVDTVVIEYSTTGPGGPWNLISAGTPALSAPFIHPKLHAKNISGGTGPTNVGSFMWTIPNTLTNDAYVRVSDRDSLLISDVSDAAFNIVAVPPQPPVWRQQASGTGAVLYSVSMAMDTSIAWAGGAGGVVFRTTNGGNTWLPAGSVGIDVYNIFAVDALTAFVASDAASNARILRTTDGGATWQQVYQSTDPAAFIDVVHMFDASNGYALGDPVGGRWVLLRTTDGGSTWALRDTLLQAGSEAGWNNSMWWVGNQYGWFGTNNTRVYRTTNGGANWSPGTTTGMLNSYSVAFADALLGMAGGSAGGQTMKSTDGGATWTASSAAGTAALLGMTALDLSTPRWYATGSGGVYKTTNHGTTWTLDHSRAGLNNIAMKVVTVGAQNYACGYAVGNAGAISKYMEGLVPVGGIAGTTTPTQFMLDQNYPNPFNPTTEIRYALPYEAAVTLKVFNILGQEIATLVNETQSAAYYRVTWDGTNSRSGAVASGIYFFRMDAAPRNGGQHFTQIRKMLMIK